MLESVSQIAKRKDIYIPDNDENLLKFMLAIFGLTHICYDDCGKGEYAEKYAVEDPTAENL